MGWTGWRCNTPYSFFALGGSGNLFFSFVEHEDGMSFGNIMLKRTPPDYELYFVQNFL